MKVEYVLKVENEYHVGSGFSRPGVVDETIFVRSDGKLVVSAEYFRGLIRDCCTQILYWTGRQKDCCEAALYKAPTEVEFQRGGVLKTCGLNYRVDRQPCVLCRIFGTTFTQKSYHFSDAEFEKFEIEVQKTIRISTHNRIDPATGRVPQDFLFSFEVGAPAVFRGLIERISPLPDSDLLLEEVGLLIAGLRLVERVGKRSSRGWGWAHVDEIILIFDDGERDKLPNQVKSEPERWDRWLNFFLMGGEESGVVASKG